MDREQQDELISAYLDGELSASEQEYVERLLETDPHARRLHEQLRAVRAQFDDLPRHQLTADLAGDILRRMETSRGTVTIEQSCHALTTRPFRALRHPRAWLWPAVAIAAALCIMLYQNRRERDNIAMRQAAEEELAARRAASDRESVIGGRDEPAKETAGDALSLPLHARHDSKVSGSLSKDSTIRTDGTLPGVVLGKKVTEVDGHGWQLKQAGENAMPSITRAGSGRAASKTAADWFDQKVVYVNCVVTPEAAQQDAFRQVLIMNSVTAVPAASDQQAQTALERAPLNKLKQELEANAKLDNIKEQDVVYAETTPAQLRATIDELKRRPSEFVHVEVEPTPASEMDSAHEPATIAGAELAKQRQTPQDGAAGGIRRDRQIVSGAAGRQGESAKPAAEIIENAPPNEQHPQAAKSRPANATGSRLELGIRDKAASESVATNAPTQRNGTKFGNTTTTPAPPAQPSARPSTAPTQQAGQRASGAEGEKMSVFFKVEVDRRQAKPAKTN